MEQEIPQERPAAGAHAGHHFLLISWAFQRSGIFLESLKLKHTLTEE